MTIGTKAVYRPTCTGNAAIVAYAMHFFLVQCAAILIASIWAFAFTLGMLWVVDRITPVRVSEETEQMGLDQGLGGETAYL